MNQITIKESSEWVLEAMKPKLEKFKAEAEQRILKFEQDNTIKFPADYRTFLAEIETIASYIGFNLEVEDEEDYKLYEYIEYIDYPQYYTFFNAKGKAIFKICDLYTIHQKASPALNATHFFFGDGKNQYFPICNNGCGDELVINLQGDDTKIYGWNHEYCDGDKQKIKPIANSFTEFLAGLKKKK